MDPEKKWYAVYTRPKWEKKVAELLTRTAIENYCPLNRALHQWSDRKKIVYEPLFTSYVFVRVAEKDHLQLKQTDGIINLVHWLGKPAVIRDAEIDIIKRFLKEHAEVKLESLNVQVNDRIRIGSGPFMDCEGRVVEVRNKTVRVVLPSLSTVMVAEVQSSSVQIIQHPAPGKLASQAKRLY